MTKLLIVDDEPLTVEMLETFLQTKGYETIGVFNGEDGVVMVQIEQPEIMILDLMLPDIEGYEVCKRIRSLPPPYAQIPVLVLSARAESASRKRAQEVGANAYLTKPVKFAELLAELSRLLDEKRMVQSAAQAPALPEVPPAQMRLADEVTRSAPPEPPPATAPEMPPVLELAVQNLNVTPLPDPAPASEITTQTTVPSPDPASVSEIPVPQEAPPPVSSEASAPETTPPASVEPAPEPPSVSPDSGQFIAPMDTEVQRSDG